MCADPLTLKRYFLTCVLRYGQLSLFGHIYNVIFGLEEQRVISKVPSSNLFYSVKDAVHSSDVL